MAKLWGHGARWENDDGVQPHEANHLTLDSSKASGRLAWRPQLRLKDALAMTIDWYQARVQGQQMREFTRSQIVDYDARVKAGISLGVKAAGVHA
jgi:CDP-glucose 4,6-dehydratase